MLVFGKNSVKKCEDVSVTPVLLIKLFMPPSPSIKTPVWAVFYKYLLNVLTAAYIRLNYIHPRCMFLIFSYVLNSKTLQLFLKLFGKEKKRKNA